MNADMTYIIIQTVLLYILNDVIIKLYPLIENNKTQSGVSLL